WRVFHFWVFLWPLPARVSRRAARCQSICWVSDNTPPRQSRDHNRRTLLPLHSRRVIKLERSNCCLIMGPFVFVAEPWFALEERGQSATLYARELVPSKPGSATPATAILLRWQRRTHFGFD